MIPMDKVGNIIYGTLNGYPEVGVTLMLSNFVGIPGLGEIGAQQMTELHYVEDDDDAIEEQDEQTNSHFLPPCKSDIRMLHTPNGPEYK